VFLAVTIDAAIVFGSGHKSRNSMEVGTNRAYLGSVCSPPAPAATAGDPTACENTPLLFAIVLPCDYMVCFSPDEEPILTFADGTIADVIKRPKDCSAELCDLEPIWVREVLDDAGLVGGCIQAFVQTDPLPADYCNGGTNNGATLSFSVCTITDGASPIDLSNRSFALSGLVTPQSDLESGMPVLDCGDIVTLPPPTATDIPTVSEWGLVIMTLLLLAGLKVRFGRFGRRPEAGSNHS
jgi:hypothetical protein